MDEFEKIKVEINGKGEIEVIGNRSGLKFLGELCISLSNLSDEELKTPANHYHFADYMNNAEIGSYALIILCKPNL